MTVHHWSLKSVERLKDWVIVLHDSLTAWHIKSLELHIVNLFTVDVVFKEEDHKVSDFVVQVLGFFCVVS